jgi:hypothetical protein
MLVSRGQRDDDQPPGLQIIPVAILLRNRKDRDWWPCFQRGDPACRRELKIVNSAFFIWSMIGQGHGSRDVAQRGWDKPSVACEK